MTISATRTKGSGAKPVRILVVEDNPGDIYLLEKTLKNRDIGYELTRYADGEQAIRALQKGDCIVPTSSFSTSTSPAAKVSMCSRQFGASLQWWACLSPS